MNKQSITFKADEQGLIKTGGIEHYASNIVAYIEATFELGENWTGYDSVRAVWSNNYLTDISTVLDPNGRCIVPTEVLTDTGNVTVNLVGSISVDDELTDRLTTYPCKALTVDEDAKVEGDETESITPSQFEQFVSIVHDEVEEVTGMSAEASTLPAGSDATASYSDGVLSLGIPRGADGADGKDGADGVTPDIDIGTVETLETGVPAYANITGTVENPSLNLGLPKGNTGDTGATGAPAGFGAVTATIDGTTGTPSVDVTASGADTAKNFAFAFHNLKGEQGEQGEQGDPGVVQDVTVNGTSVVDQNGVAVITMPELVKTVQGNPIVIDDAFGAVKNLTVELLPIQEGTGTPSPSNVRPITGHDSVTVTDRGKNLLPNDFSDYAIGRSYILTPNAIMPDGLQARMTFFDNDTSVSTTGCYMGFIQGDYTVTEVLSPTDFRWCMSNGTIAQNTSNESQTHPGVICTKIFIYPNTEETFNKIFSRYNIMVEYGDTAATAYTPYITPTTKTVTLPHTVYGAGVGVTSGNGKTTMAMIDLGTLDYVVQSGIAGLWSSYSTLPNAKPNVDNSTVPNAVADNYGTITPSAAYSQNIGITITTGSKIWLFDNNYASASALKTALSGHYLCYELDTPTDLSTTPTDITLYNGDNVISSDGDMTMDYVQDMAIVIEKLENLL